MRKYIIPLSLLFAVLSCSRVDSTMPEGGAAPSSEEAPTDDGRKLIKTGEMTLEVEELEESMQTLERLAAEIGATIVERDTRHGGARSARVVVGVPSERLGNLMTALRPLGDVESSRQSTLDITDTYRDMETRLGIKRQTIVRLRAMIEHPNASLTDLIAVERELARVLEEVEVMEAKRQRYDQQIEIATLTLHISEPRLSIAAAVEGAKTVAVGVLTVIFYVIAFFGPPALIGGIGWLAVRRFRRRLA